MFLVFQYYQILSWPNNHSQFLPHSVDALSRLAFDIRPLQPKNWIPKDMP